MSDPSAFYMAPPPHASLAGGGGGVPMPMQMPMPMSMAMQMQMRAPGEFASMLSAAGGVGGDAAGEPFANKLLNGNVCAVHSTQLHSHTIFNTIHRLLITRTVCVQPVDSESE